MLTIYYCKPYANTASSISLTISTTYTCTPTITPTNTATITPNRARNTPLFGGIYSGAGKVRDSGPIHYQLSIYYITGINIAGIGWVLEPNPRYDKLSTTITSASE
jgi:hypothetical protein